MLAKAAVVRFCPLQVYQSTQCIPYTFTVIYGNCVTIKQEKKVFKLSSSGSFLFNPLVMFPSIKSSKSF